MFGVPDRRTQPNIIQDRPPRMPTRRNLSAQLPQQSLQSAQSQAFEEGMLPLQFTPKPVQKTIQVQPLSNMDPNTTFEIIDNDHQTDNNATIIISRGSPCQKSKSTDLSGRSLLQHPPKAAEGNQLPSRR